MYLKACRSLKFIECCFAAYINSRLYLLVMLQKGSNESEQFYKSEILSQLNKTLPSNYQPNFIMIFKDKSFPVNRNGKK